MEEKKTLLSGIQPSGQLHVGNYFGAMRQFVDYQEEYDTYISIVNFHALTTVQDRKKLQGDTFNAVVDHLAVGLDPQKSTIFLQSEVPEVTELAWIFNTLVTVPYLERGVSYKDKVSQGQEASSGLLTYPVLQAADILIMNADVVPVGQDQKQHLEMARDIAQKFNVAYGETFTSPKSLIREGVAVVPGVDGQKMSKSYGNTIPLFASDKEIEKMVMSIPTDSKSPEEPKDPEKDIVFQLHKLFAGDKLDGIREGYEKGGLSYADSKKELAGSIVNFVRPMRERREEIMSEPKTVLRILENGAEKARSRAMLLMHDIREKVGLKI